MKTFIIPTSTAEYLAGNLRGKLKDFRFVIPEKNREGKRLFPDGEAYMRISEIKNLEGGRVIVLHSGIPQPNTGLMELELILQILKDHGIRPEVFFTYFPYGRQDKVFESGETNVAENLIKKIINYYKARKIYTIDAHFGKMAWVKKYPITDISAVPLLVKNGKKDFGPGILFLSPDKGGKRRTGISGVNKKRINSFEVTPFSSKIFMKGKTIGVVDDMIGTGGTLLRFYEFANNSGAKKIAALITHGVLDTGIRNVKKTFAKLYLTNTVDKKEANTDITGLIADAIKK